ncbi:MAG TPA: hypothetical protein VIY49_08800 [Bryobacteraceae bacterium]
MQPAPNPQGFREFAAFLKEELAPYPGRTAIVTRIVTAGEATSVFASPAESLGQALNASLLPAARVRSPLTLLRGIDALTTSLDKRDRPLEAGVGDKQIEELGLGH